MDISAKHLRIGFRLGIYDYDDVQRWVDSIILKSNEPCEEIIELSFSKREAIHEVYSLLSSLPNTDEDDETLMKVLGDIKDEYLNDIRYCRDLSKSLYSYYIDSDYDVDEKLVDIGYFDDAYDLAVQGIGDTVESWHLRFQEFVNEFRNC